MKAARVQCKLCGARVEDTFVGKWKHAVEKHPETAAEMLLRCQVPMVREAGFQLGRRLRESGVTLDEALARFKAMLE